MATRILTSRLAPILVWLITATSVALPQERSVSSPWQRPDNSKAFFESVGLKFDEVKDVDPEFKKHLENRLRVLARLRQLPLGVIGEWSKQPPSLELILEGPESHRGELYRFEGVVSSLKTVEIPEEMASRFDVKSLLKLTVNVANIPVEKAGIGGSAELIEVWTTQIPSGLKVHEGDLPPGGSLGGHQLQVPHVKLDALFLSIGKQLDGKKPGDGQKFSIFVTNKVEWFPQSVDEGNDLTPSKIRLASAAFDIGLLDAVRAETSKRLTAEVTEPFLNMLAAQARVDWTGLETKPLELGKLIDQPRPFIGEAIEFDAIARRVIEIPIENESDRKRLGLERYYEIDVVIPKAIRTLVKDKDGREQEIVQENFPVTICATTPPKGLALEQDIRDQIHAKAFFFKLWAYESKFAKSHAGDALQVSPLFITDTIQVVAPPEMSFTSALWLILGGIGILACVAIWGYLLLRSDDKSQRSRQSSPEEVAPVALPASNHEPPGINPPST